MHDGSVRTTVEIDDEKWVKLKKLAAERGEKGFSKLIDEALGSYLDHVSDESVQERRDALLALRGVWDEETAETVRERIAESRKHWR